MLCLSMQEQDQAEEEVEAAWEAVAWEDAVVLEAEDTDTPDHRDHRDHQDHQDIIITDIITIIIHTIHIMEEEEAVEDAQVFLQQFC